jgi:hypothetical protein
MTKRSRVVKGAGIVGAAVGVAAAGLAAAFAVERALVRRSVNAPGDPYVDEPFGDQPFDRELTVTAADGTDLHVEIIEPAGAPGEPTIVFVHGFALDMGTFYFQRTGWSSTTSRATADPASSNRAPMIWPPWAGRWPRC